MMADLNLVDNIDKNDPNPKNLQELTQYVQSLLQNMQDKFQTMSDQILNRIDDMGNRVDDLEKNISDLMTQAGAAPYDAQTPGGVGGVPQEPR
jgi:heat shock factor-binding protein 1